MGSKGSAPPPPDYAGLAKQQGIANREAAIASASLSNPNMITPTGTRSISYAKDPTTGEFTPTITDKLTPEAEQAFKAQQRVDLALSQLGEQGIGQVQKVMGTPFKYTGPGIQTSLNLSNAPKMPIDAGTTAQQAIMKRLQPQIEQNRASLQQNLANQGITPGSEAWDRAMTEQQQGESDLYSQAAAQGINMDMAARTQAVNEALQSGQFGNTAAQQALQQQLGLYNVPLNQIAALMSGSQIQMPQFQSYSGQNIAAAPIFEAGKAQYQSAMDAYNAKQAGSNALMSGLFGVAGAALGGPMGGQLGSAIGKQFSDRRLKRDIEKIGALDSGLNLYKYKYIWDDVPQIGVMADEVRQIFPEAVSVASNGYDMVDYSRLI